MPKPDAGLDPGTPGSRPGPKAGAKPLSHPGIPFILIYMPLNILGRGSKVPQGSKPDLGLVLSLGVLRPDQLMGPPGQMVEREGALTGREVGRAGESPGEPHPRGHGDSNPAVDAPVSGSLRAPKPSDPAKPSLNPSLINLTPVIPCGYTKPQSLGVSDYLAGLNADTGIGALYRPKLAQAPCPPAPTNGHSLI